jgi:hypothetical protein
MKIPVEECLINSSLWYWFHGHSKPESHKYGHHHYNGHLRGYTVQKAIRAVASHFAILDKHVTHVAHFYGGSKQRWLGKYLGERFTTGLFGGAVFILGISKIHCEPIKEKSKV